MQSLYESSGEVVRLVGQNPHLHITNAGPTPNPSPSNPATQRSLLRLVASEGQKATMAEASVILDRGVIAALRSGDRLHIVRTGCGRIGISAVRDDQLIFAVGAITSVPLGRDFRACVPYQLMREAEAVFRKHDPEFEFREYPVEFQVGSEQRIFHRARIRLGDFEIYMLHGHYNDIPGTDPYISAVRVGACSVVDANTSALFLDTNHFSMVRW
jgi:hypothetical protein